MTEQKQWDGATVRTWLESRFAAARSEQDRADRGGRAYEDDYDKAAAEEWVCSRLQGAADVNDQPAFAKRIKDLIGQDDYPVTGIYDDVRFERHVRSYLRKLAKMAKTNEGFENALRYQ